MIGEYHLTGVFFSAALVSALIAYALSLALRLILARVGFYRFVWHAALFDMSLFLILWALVAWAPWLGPR